jgi:prepilin-type N-terminal cleavage/methylation domain-containing protein
MVKRSGFALIEVIVALTLLSVGLLGVAGSAVLATRLLHEGDASEQALSAALPVLDSLSLLRAPAAGSQQAGNVRLVWGVSTDSVGISTIDLTLTYLNGSALRSTSFRMLSALP